DVADRTHAVTVAAKRGIIELKTVAQLKFGPLVERRVHQLVLSAVAEALVGDVADVVRIDTLRSAPLITDRSAKDSRAIDRMLIVRPRRLESSPAQLLPKVSHFFRPLSRSAPTVPGAGG